MKIAFFSDSFYPELGGIQDSLLAIARTLAVRGHQVVCCAPSFSRRDCTIGNVPYDEPEMPERMTVRRFASWHFPSSTLQSRCVFPTFLRWRSLKEFAPDIVHTHTFFGVGLEALAAARALRVPLIGTNHWAVGAFNPNPLLRRASLYYVTWYYNHCALVTAPSRSVVHEMLGCGLRVAQEVISNPIDTTLFSPPSPEQTAALKQKFGFGDATIAYAGRLASEKHIDVIIRAVALLRERVPRVTLAIAGHGNARGDLEALARGLGVERNVRFLGTLGKADLANLLRASELFAIASTTETQSMTLLQAMACGLPAIGVDSLALPEYIEHHRTGSIVPVGDSAAMSEAMERLLGNPAERVACGMRAHSTVSEQYGTAAIVHRLERIYERELRSL